MITKIICGQAMVAFAYHDGTYLMATQLLQPEWWQRFSKEKK